jgi:sn-glycerol 3-phosphate transport system permease protein
MPVRRSLLPHVYGWLLLLPAAVLLATFTHYPTVASVWESLFQPATATRPGRFVGLDNYVSMFGDPAFRQALFNNVWFALGTIPAAIALAILMALIADSRLPGRVLMRMAYFTPTILPMIAVANIWLFFYTPGIGLLDQVLGSLGLPGHNWLGDPNTVMWCLIVMMIWKEAGFFMIFYLAALQSISPDLREAAQIEGASRWTYFRRVTFPLLMPTTLFVLITALINSFRVVDQLFIMTKGGPDNASMLLLYYIYETAFSFFDSAEAAAQTVFLLAVLIGLAIAQYVLLEKRIHYR